MGSRGKTPGGLQGALSRGHGPGSWEGPQAPLVQEVPEWTEGRKEGRAGGSGAVTGQGVKGRPEEERREEGKVKKPPAYQHLERPHPSACCPLWWSHQLPRTWLRSVSSPGPRVHMYEAQLMMPHQAKLLVLVTPTCSQPSRAT